MTTDLPAQQQGKHAAPGPDPYVIQLVSDLIPRDYEDEHLRREAASE